MRVIDLYINFAGLICDAKEQGLRIRMRYEINLLFKDLVGNMMRKRSMGYMFKMIDSRVTKMMLSMYENRKYKLVDDVIDDSELL